jgi:hypothetical protein
MMKKFKSKLVNCTSNLVRGDILRCKGRWPYEKLVDFMIVETLVEGVLLYSLLVASGYKAGLIFTRLPIESIPEENEGFAVNTSWLRDNWMKWGYFECPLEDVYILENLPPSGLPRPRKLK